MTVKEFGQGELIYTSGQKMKELYLIMKGFVCAEFPGESYILRAGDVIGLCELGSLEALIEYRATEKCSMFACPLGQGNSAPSFFENADTVKYLLSSFFRQFNAMLGRQKQLENECTGLLEYWENCCKEYNRACEMAGIADEMDKEAGGLSEFSPKCQLPFWISGYYATLEQIMAIWDHNKTDMDFAYGFLTRAAADMRDVMRLSMEMQAYKKQICSRFMDENGADLLGRYLSAYYRTMKQSAPSKEAAVHLKTNMKEILMQLKAQGYEDLDFYERRKAEVEKLIEHCESHPADNAREDEAVRQQMEQLTGSLDQILSYANCDRELEFAFRQNILKYKKLANRNGTEEAVRILRRELTEGFYQIYIAAFQNSIGQETISAVLKMFFCFGYMDEELAGIQNALYLYQIVEHLPTDPAKGVYSFYEWLMAIYRGEKEPGRNEFDMDYTEDLREKKRLGKITLQEEEALLQSRSAKVMFELENVFPIVNKVSYGRISVFCPIFSENDVLKPLDDALVSAEKIEKIFHMIRRVDYSAYYRQAVYSDMAAGITREFVDMEILPDIILTPNVGSRGVMWQEIEGKRRTTPARMMCSVFQTEDLTMTMVRLTAEFRWEMCKRIQGARWNDVSDPSLTSEYFDYAQFYKKNSELSTAAKEKVKNDIIRARNSFKEFFVMDYLLWIFYESNGSPRLNKVARNILFTYCPFSREIRDKLGNNPMYREILERYEIHMQQKRHRLENLCQKLKSQGKEIPEQIEKQRQYLEL